MKGFNLYSKQEQTNVPGPGKYQVRDDRAMAQPSIFQHTLAGHQTKNPPMFEPLNSHPGPGTYQWQGEAGRKTHSFGRVKQLYQAPL